MKRGSLKIIKRGDELLISGFICVLCVLCVYYMYGGGRDKSKAISTEPDLLGTLYLLVPNQ